MASSRLFKSSSPTLFLYKSTQSFYHLSVLLANLPIHASRGKYGGLVGATWGIAR